MVVGSREMTELFAIEKPSEKSGGRKGVRGERI